MSDAVIGALRAVLGLDTTTFEEGGEKAVAKMEGWASEIGVLGTEISESFGRAGEAIADSFGEKITELAGGIPVLGGALSAIGPIGLAAAAGLGAFGEAAEQAHKSMEWAADIQKNAELIGISAEALQQYQYAATKTDVSIEALREGLQGLNGSLGAIQSGVGAKRVQQAFDALGISKESLADMHDATDLMPLLADRMSNVGSVAEQVQIAKKLHIEELLPLLREGGDGVKELTDQAENLGLVMSNKTVSSMTELNKQVEIANQRIGVGMKEAFVGLAPVLEGITSKLADFVQGLSQAISKGGELKNLEIAMQDGDPAAFQEGLHKGLRGKDLTDYVQKNGTKDYYDPSVGVSTESIGKTFNIEKGAGLPDAITSGDAAKKLAELRQQALALVDSLTGADTTIFSKMDADLVKLTTDLKAHLITQDQFTVAMAGAKDRAHDMVMALSATPDEKGAAEYIKTVNIANEALKRAIITGREWNEVMANAGAARNAADAITKISLPKLGDDHLKPLEDSLKRIPVLTNPVVDALQQVGDKAAESFGQAIANGQSLGKSFDQLWRNIEADFISSGLQDMIASLLGVKSHSDGGGILGAVFDNIFAGGLPAHANGIDMSLGGIALVGERGPEVVNLPRGASVTSNENLRAALSGRGAGGGVNNNVTVNAQGAILASDIFKAINAMGSQATVNGTLGGSQMAMVQSTDMQKRQIP